MVQVITMENSVVWHTWTSPTIISKAWDWMNYEWTKFVLKFLGPHVDIIDAIILILWEVQVLYWDQDHMLGWMETGTREVSAGRVDGAVIFDPLHLKQCTF